MLRRVRALGYTVYMCYLIKFQSHPWALVAVVLDRYCYHCPFTDDAQRKGAQMVQAAVSHQGRDRIVTTDLALGL